MRKILFLIVSAIFLFNISVSYAAVPSTNDPVHLYEELMTEDDSDYIYRTWHERGGDTGYFYQLRDVSGADDNHSLAGSQWFAIVPENWFTYRYVNPTGRGTDYITYWRTLGGEAPTIPVTTSADILHDFDYAYIQEPEPYPASAYYDTYMDPLVNLFLVIKEGQGELNVNFGNHYARHFPYWWDERGGYTNNIFSTSVREKLYTYDTAGIYDLKTPANTVYTISGDGVYSGTSTTLVYTISNDNILNTSGDVVYTTETYGNYIFVYDANKNSSYMVYNNTIYSNLRTVREDVSMNLGDDYTVSVTPSEAQSIAPGNSLKAKFTINALDAQNYGSTKGTLSFRQSAVLDTGYSGWRENLQVPIVVANVYDGPASEAGNELYFDMIISNSSGDIIKRNQFRWGVDEDMTHDLGNFFLPTSARTSPPTYTLETRITNRTGTRYRVQGYDRLASNNDISINDTETLPLHWRFDIPSDGYQSLRPYFYLDSHSQVAPGLVTVYKTNMTIDSGTQRSFRMYPFGSDTYKTLTLAYQRFFGIIAQDTPAASLVYNNGAVKVSGFCFENGFIDSGYTGSYSSNNTEEDIKNRITKLTPVMLNGSSNISTINSAVAAGVTIDNSASQKHYYPVKIDIDVNELIEVISHDYIVSYDASGDAISIDNGPAYVPLLPLIIRFEIPKGDELLNDANWAKLYNASGTQTVLDKFMEFGYIGVSSTNTDELGYNLFNSKNLQAAADSTGLNAVFNAFLDDDNDDSTLDKLVLEFKVFLADGSSSKDKKTAYINKFEDDNVEYIIIGDGKQDDQWTLSFFVADIATDPGQATSNGNASVEPTAKASGGGGGGGGCNALMSVLPLILFAYIAFSKKFKN